jgi:hypothetical protein
MRNKRIVRIGLVAIVVVIVSLVALTETSLAQGPGGRGRGGAGQSADSCPGYCGGDGERPGYGFGAQDGSGYGQGYGAMMMNQTQAQYRQWLAANLPPAVPGPLPEDVVAALNAALQDEYNAYATYQAVIDQFGAVRPFTNIQQAEANHIAALTFLFERYGLPVTAPAPLDSAPAFGTLADACAVGAAAEVANFGLYDSWLETAQDYPDITQVFTSLRNASEFNHLPAFERCAG